MQYVSTRGEAPHLNFEEAMLSGLARDGGLYVPHSWPRLSAEEIRSFAFRPYEEVAFAVMKPFIGDCFTDAEFRAIIARAYAGFRHKARCPLVQLAPDHYLLELFHGPTLAFKDVAMQLIGQMFAAVLERRNERVTIVGATSGDTGSAAMAAFAGLGAVDVFIMYPHGRVSEVQRRQMTTLGAPNVHALALDGDFDDCQARLKDMFNDHGFRDRTRLAGVNSINWARVLAQVVYYFTAAASLGAPERAVSFSVPTGNFGDIFAGFVAKKMGLPIKDLVIATNQNDILHRTVAANDHRKAGLKASISPSMDIQVSSNFERLLFELYGRDAAAVRGLMASLSDKGGFALSDAAYGQLRAEFASGACSEDETAAAIASFFAASGETLCPHSAIGAAVAQAHLLAAPESAPMVTLATAHPAKFPDAVEAATAARPALPPHMADLFARDERVTHVANDLAEIEALIEERIRA